MSCTNKTAATKSTSNTMENSPPQQRQGFRSKGYFLFLIRVSPLHYNQFLAEKMSCTNKTAAMKSTSNTMENSPPQQRQGFRSKGYFLFLIRVSPLHYNQFLAEKMSCTNKTAATKSTSNTMENSPTQRRGFRSKGYFLFLIREPKMNMSLPSKTKKISCWNRPKQKFTTRDEKNKCCGDTAPDVEPKMNKSLPSKTKKISCWKRLKQKFTTHDKKNKCCGDTAPDVEPKMNKSLPSKTKKISCWKRLKQKFTTHDKKNKCCGDTAPDVNAELKVINESVEEEYAEPQVTNVSAGEKLRTGSSLRHGEDDKRTFSYKNRVLPEFDVGHVVFDEWEVISKIGEGSTGFVYKAKNVNSAKKVALKLTKSVGDGDIMLHEARIMKKLHHYNIVQIIYHWGIRMDNRCASVLEYVGGGSLTSQILLLRKLTERELWCPMKQMADAVEFMHYQNIVHRDIKTQNVFFTNKGIVKVIDFKAARSFLTRGEKMFTCCGTRGYMAPEITAHGYEGPPVDVWALGVLFTKLFVGLHFDGRNIIETSHDKTDFIVGNSSPTFARETLVSLLTAMLRKDPMERFTMTEVVNHTWFKENHQDQVESLWNAEPKVTNESVEEESPTGFSPEWNESLSWLLLPCTQEAKGRVKHSGSSLSHGADDERTSSDEHRVLPEFDVGHVVVSKTFNYLFPVIARFESQMLS
uniref:uncharacterized protein n=1 Tax=Myxine glutinosa TaxID=7769 RepID=UPI00358F4811